MSYPMKCLNCSYIAASSLHMIKHRHQEHAHMRTGLISRKGKDIISAQDAPVGNPPKQEMRIIRPT